MNIYNGAASEYEFPITNHEGGTNMREDRMNYIEKEISKTPLYGLLGAEGIEELRSKIIDLIVKQVKKDLSGSAYYIISPDDITDTLNESIVQEAIDEIKDEWKDNVKTYMNKKLEEMLK